MEGLKKSMYDRWLETYIKKTGSRPSMDYCLARFKDFQEYEAEEEKKKCRRREAIAKARQ